MVELLI